MSAFSYRIRFTKEENVKYISHIDLMKTMERALRRAGLPVAHSEGFHPHPRLSFGPALAVGISSMDEYLDLTLEQELRAEEIMTAMNRNLPPGIRILAVKRLEKAVKTLSAVLNRASYLLTVKTEPSRQSDVLRRLQELPQQQHIFVERKTPEETKTVDIRPWLWHLSAAVVDPEILAIDVTGEIGSGGNMRPTDLIAATGETSEVIRIVRTGLWQEDKGQIKKPMDF